MAIFKANYCKRGKTERSLAKASIRYIQHRRGKDGEKITRTLFNQDGPMDRQDAYSIIDEAKKGSYFYRFILSPDPKKEDHNHDLDMRDIAERTMLALEERLGVPIQWVGATHADHAPHLHAHLIAVVPKRLYVKDYQELRARATEACLEQREFLDLIRGHVRERPYPLPTSARTLKTSAWRTRHAGVRWGRYEKTGAPSVSRSNLQLQTCACPQCSAVHIHNTRDPVHRCSCGLLLHRNKTLSLTRERGKELALEL